MKLTGNPKRSGKDSTKEPGLLCPIAEAARPLQASTAFRKGPQNMAIRIAVQLLSLHAIPIANKFSETTAMTNTQPQC